MRLTDISLNWLLPGAVLLLGMLAAVAVLARSKRSGGEARERRLVGAHARSAAGARRPYTASPPTSFCSAVRAVAAGTLLPRTGRLRPGEPRPHRRLGVPGPVRPRRCGHVLLRPRGTAEASHGDAALGSRILVWTFAAAAAWFNWVHAPQRRRTTRALRSSSPACRCRAAVLFDRALKQTRRAALREQGLVLAPAAADPYRPLAAGAPRDLQPPGR
ncbi:DUF2637 domain-containing protein [Streptomyces sp. L7]